VTGAYIHGTDPDEQARLSRLNDLLNQQSLSRLQLAAGERVLDVGSGLGQFARRMAEAVGTSGCVVGVERSEQQIEEGNRQAVAAGEAGRVDVRAGDAAELPLRADEWGTFDVAHARFVLEHVPNPERVVEGMVRAVRPGGRIVLEDDDHDALILHPAVPAFMRIWQDYVRSYERVGNDPRIGRALPALLASAGARPSRCDWPFFGACAGSEHFETIIRNCRGILTGARTAIQSAHAMTDADFEAGIAAYDAWSRRPDASYWYCTFWAEGFRPGR